jgi:hypothetical protein
MFIGATRFWQGMLAFYFSEFFEFFGSFLRRALRQTPGKPPATWHQFGTKTQRWSGYFLEWRGARSARDIENALIDLRGTSTVESLATKLTLDSSKTRFPETLDFRSLVPTTLTT